LFSPSQVKPSLYNILATPNAARRFSRARVCTCPFGAMMYPAVLGCKLCADAGCRPPVLLVVLSFLFTNLSDFIFSDALGMLEMLVRGTLSSYARPLMKVFVGTPFPYFSSIAVVLQQRNGGMGSSFSLVWARHPSPVFDSSFNSRDVFGVTTVIETWDTYGEGEPGSKCVHAFRHDNGFSSVPRTLN
jgi:hypothetical protein